MSYDRPMHFGPLSPNQFLRQYWQKKPLMIHQAFPDFKDPITPDELAGLACEEDVTSRLVMEKGGHRPWQVTHGPQKASQLRKLPPSHWTLLVQGVDRLVPGVAALMAPFRFIPDWRLDDVMISFAPRFGTVGPHVDSYDVFLLQGKGRRRWKVDSRAPLALKPGLDLRILKHFQTEQEWVLEPGDMLYLPPGLAHYGVALEDCLTYSIGFRAPSGMDLLVAAQERISQSDVTANRRYSDPTLRPTTSPGEIPLSAVQSLRKLMEQNLASLSHPDFATMAGELLTEPKSMPDPGDASLTAKHMRHALKKGRRLLRSPASRMGYIRSSPIQLFADGQCHLLDPRLAFAAPLLCNHRELTAAQLQPHLHKKGFLPLVIQLIQQGSLVIR